MCVDIWWLYDCWCDLTWCGFEVTGREVIIIFLWPHTVKLSPLCKVTVWPIFKECDIWDDPALGWVTTFYANTTWPHWVSCVFGRHDSDPSSGRVNWYYQNTDRPYYANCFPFFFLTVGNIPIILHRVGYPDFTWTLMGMVIIKYVYWTRCKILIEIRYAAKFWSCSNTI